MNPVPPELEQWYHRFLEGRGDSIGPLICVLRDDRCERASSRAWAALILSRIYLVKGSIRLASSYLSLSSRLFRTSREGGDPYGLLVNRAIILKMGGRVRAADTLLRSVFKRAVCTGHTFAAAKAASNLAALLARRGATEEAGTYLSVAGKIYEAAGCGDGLLRVRLIRVLLDSAAGSLRVAADGAFSVVARTGPGPLARERLTAELLLAEVLLGLDECDGARAVLDGVESREYDLRRFRPQRLMYLELRRQQLLRDGDREAAGRIHETAGRLRSVLGLGDGHRGRTGTATVSYAASGSAAYEPGERCGPPPIRGLRPPAAARAAGCEVAPADRPNGFVVFNVHERVNGETRCTGEWFGTGHERLLSLLSDIRDAAVLPLPILLEGESGTGKEVVARFVHEWSGRIESPFVTVNAAALPRDLLESALFGHVRGAFTGAVSTHHGLVESAGAGTLLLDEIGEVEPAVQAKLLRLIDRGEFIPLGGCSIRSCRARIIAATNRNLREAVVQGVFRDDLYHRLNVLGFTIPPLRQRRSDIPVLAELLLADASGCFSLGPLRIGEGARELLAAYDWPGNVRELKNEIIRAAVRRKKGTVRISDFSSNLLSFSRTVAPGALDSLSYRISSVERAEILKALQECGGNRARSARLLGMKRTTLIYRMKRLGIG